MDSPFTARDMDCQAVLSDQALDLEAQASAQEADMELPALGLEQVPGSMALPQQGHRERPEALWAYPASHQRSQFSFPNSIMAKAMGVMVSVDLMA